MNLPFLNKSGQGAEGQPASPGVVNGYAPYEELESKKTTKLGMVFVVIMIIAGIWQGQALLRSIQSAFNPPENLSQCYYNAVYRADLSISQSRDYSFSTYGDYYYPYGRQVEEGCRFSEIEQEYGFPQLYGNAEPKIKELAELEKELSRLESELSSLKYNKERQQRDYNTSLFEDMSGNEADVYSSNSISQALSAMESEIAALTARVDDQRTKVESKKEEIAQIFKASSFTLEKIATEQEKRVRALELKRFFTSLILLAPLVWFTVRKYFKSKNERSQYAVIWGGAALVASILFGQVLVIFVYRILPKRIIEALIDFLQSLLQSFAFLGVILQWFGFILIPLFFGFLVYKIQKKFYNPLAVAMRSIKEGKCPQCAMKIKDAMVHCPMCSFNLRVSCPSCSATSVCFAKYCETCGKALPEQATSSAK